MADRTGGQNRLAALGAHLSARGFTIVLAADGLHVTSQDAAEVVHCRSRGEDFGNRWFFTRQGRPIAPADCIVDAAVFITGHLTGPRIEDAEATR